MSGPKLGALSNNKVIGGVSLVNSMQNMQHTVCKSKVFFYNFYSLHFSVERVLMIAINPSEKGPKFL
jgi:hypothetical protein